jgi:hypothetical protein
MIMIISDHAGTFSRLVCEISQILGKIERKRSAETAVFFKLPVFPHVIFGISVANYFT